MTQLPEPLPDWALYCQLLQQLISGNVRRNTFTPWEMELLLDIQTIQMRKSSRPEMLRRYLRAVQQQAVSGETVPLRFSQFFETITQARRNGPHSQPLVGLPRAS